MEIAIIAYSVALLAVVFLSRVIQKTALSTAVIILASGFIVGNGFLGYVNFKPTDTTLENITILSMVAVLYTDGMRLDFRQLAAVWVLPGRALFLGIPLTVLLIAALAHLIVGLPWIDSFLTGAVLSPTDPVFASAIVSRRVIPLKLRRLLNVESGMNDGLALPIVLALLALITPAPFSPLKWLGDVVFGVLIGLTIPWLILRIYHAFKIQLSKTNQIIFGVTILLIVYSIVHLVQANLFLASFTAGMVVVTVSPEVKDAFWDIGEAVAEILKLTTIYILGSIISLTFFKNLPASYYLFTPLVFILARPLAIWISFLGTRLNRAEEITAAWFGPRGFASVVYGLYVYRSGASRAITVFNLVATVIVISMVVYSTTDIFFVRWFLKHEQQKSVQGSTMMGKTNEKL